jgi:hypothetical protein
MSLIGINILEPDWNVIENLSLEYHIINAKDDYFQLG